MDFVAHIRENDKKMQTVKEHLMEVKELAELYGEKNGIKHITGLAGLLHDLGKYTNRFRDYIVEAVKNPLSPPKRGSVDHSTAGGKLLFEYFHSNSKVPPYKQLLAEIVGNSIISHHSYLQDFLTPDLESKYLQRVREKVIEEFSLSKKQFFSEVMSEKEFNQYIDLAASELESYIAKDPTKNIEEKAMFLTKFVFSCLIDADRTNTRLFEENKKNEIPNRNQELFHQYDESLERKINSFKDMTNAQNPINKLRSEMSEQCKKFAEQPSGIYTLSIPTGGGKTLASLRYALKHARYFNKNRIIYVVPYTTIIEQNAEEVRNILHDRENILEHHSNVINDVNEDDEKQSGMMNLKQKLKLAKDNWDAPIIFTTMVQFLNVFYAKGSRNIRRLHNLSESVIIFDEVQKVPIHCVSLFNHALNYLKTYCHASIVLCTATQPALDFVEHKLEINTDGEMIKNLDEVIEAFTRVQIIDRATTETFDNEKLSDFISDRLGDLQSILVILNTKQVVKNLYKLLKDQFTSIPIYHLSTSMCAAHRNQILEEIRHHLSAGEKIICISTQLIEAGVDVSFQCVIRSLAGLDSIAQAAGRCNRHGENEIQNVYVIDHAEENLNHLKEISEGKKISKRILIDIHDNPKNHGGNILSRQAMERYFKEYFIEFKSDLNYEILKIRKNIIELLMVSRGNNKLLKAYSHNKGEKLPLLLANSYYTCAENFKVIDNITTSIIVPFEEGKEIIADLSSDRSIQDLSEFLRKSQQYTINVYSHELKQLEKNEGLVHFLDGNVLALREGAYSEEFGLDLENESGLDINIF